MTGGPRQSVDVQAGHRFAAAAIVVVQNGQGFVVTGAGPRSRFSCFTTTKSAADTMRNATSVFTKRPHAITVAPASRAASSEAYGPPDSASRSTK